MSIISSLTDVYLKFNRKVLFDAKSQKKHRDMQDQRKYLEHFKEPKDEYEKAYLSAWVGNAYGCRSLFRFG